MNINLTNTRTRRSTLAATILGGVLLAAGCGNAPRGEDSRLGFGPDGAASIASTVTLEAPDVGDDYPVFWAVVSFQVTAV